MRLPMGPTSFVPLAKGMLRSLQYLHKNGLMHRDVKVSGLTEHTHWQCQHDNVLPV